MHRQQSDQVYSYQIAVVVDDEEQKITEVLRGTDLLDSTPRQIYLQNLLKISTPAYCHVPVIVDEHGAKLSKQSLAEPVDSSDVSGVLSNILSLLDLAPPAELSNAPAEQLLSWGIENWAPSRLSQLNFIPMI